MQHKIIADDKRRNSSKVTFKKCDSLKNHDKMLMGMLSGRFQLSIGSIASHFFSSTNVMKAFMSRVPVYRRNWPFVTWKMVGKAVTKNLPESPGLSLKQEEQFIHMLWADSGSDTYTTSTLATLMDRSSLHDPKSLQTGSRFLHAGHHGAKLK